MILGGFRRRTAVLNSLVVTISASGPQHAMKAHRDRFFSLHMPKSPFSMQQTVRDLSPASLWNHFANLNAVPRPSKKEARIIQFMVDFGESLGLATTVDDIGNVVIRKPATPGMENRQTVVLQSHLDMVHQQNAGTGVDFESEGIKMFVEDDWVKAHGTTLGADNGIGVAAIMAILSASDIPHPALEGLFTIDEETGMTGALGLQGGILEASIMLNLDTEDDHELTIGCAGGIDVSARGQSESEPTPENHHGLAITIKGLTGGHSGMDIDKGRGNANKLMNRLVQGLEQQTDIRLASVDGGGLRNAIPRESHAIVTAPQEQVGLVRSYISKMETTFQAEYHVTDPGLTVTVEPIAVPDTVLTVAFQAACLKAVYACPNGIYRLSPDIQGLVQTSNNLARVLITPESYECLCLTRSSVDSEKMDVAAMITSVFQLIGAQVSTGGDYPGWTPNPTAPIISTMTDLYKEMFQEEPHVAACHAGLECGILGTNYPGMDMISFGPNIRGAHSPDEKVQISSVQKFWRYLLETLTRIPVQ